MHKIRGPFPELIDRGIPDIALATEDGILDQMDAVHSALVAAGCKCNGEARGKIRDADWGADISELVTRSSPHEINDTGLGIRRNISVKLSTLVAEVDENDEVCVWIYEES